MLVGFDYGTSNCAIGVFESLSQPSQLNHPIQLIPLDKQNNQPTPYLPSLVYSESRESIVEYVSQHISATQDKADFCQARKGQLTLAQQFRLSQGIPNDEVLTHFGHQAMAEYQQAPQEGFFAKSPKSFLGATGLSQGHLDFFEDIVAAMMLHANQQCIAHTASQPTDVVIGRPVNFSNLDSAKGNKQAIDLLTRAAKRCGYQNIEFLYEPLAAGLAFEQSLPKDQLVLVLDIGGGTSDCTIMHMGPSYKDKLDRTEQVIAHTGIRIGGNDLDIALAAHSIMPLLGMGSETKDGLPIPAKYFLNAVRINDVNAQKQFYSTLTHREITALQSQAKAPLKTQRLLTLLEEQKNFAVIKSCEQTKIDLSLNTHCNTALDYLESGLETNISVDDFTAAITRPLQQIISLLDETLQQAQSQPDAVFITGGSGQSPVVRQAVQAFLKDIPVVDGDHFGSVVNGLTHWAQKCFA